MTDLVQTSDRSSSRTGTVLFRLRAWYAKYGEYRRLRGELGRLNARELRDLGIDPYDVDGFARDHAFGRRAA